MKKDSPTSWIEKNIIKMMGQVSMDARHQRPMPLSITMNPIALNKFVDILKSKSSFFPDDKDGFTFLTVPVRSNSRLPYGSFTIERFHDTARITPK